MEMAGPLTGSGQPLAGGTVGPGLDRLPLTPGIPGNPPDGHLDPEPGGGALLLGLAAPEAVLPVLTPPGPAGFQHGADLAQLTSLRLPAGAGLGPFPRRCEEEPGLAAAHGTRSPSDVGQLEGESAQHDDLS